MLDLFTKGDIEQYEWEGRQVVLALRKSRNAGIKAVAEGGGLPTAGKQGYANLKIPMTFLEGRIELTAQVMKASRSDKGSFARAMDSEQKGLVEDISRQRNRELAYYGAGTLATVASGATSFTQTVTAPGGVAGTVNTSRFIKVGMMIAFTSPSGVIRTDGIMTVTSVTDTGSGSASIVGTGTGSGPATTTGDLVSLGANASGTNEGSFNLESMGILGIVDSTSYVSSIFGLDRSNSANAWFRSTVMSSVGALSPDILQRGVDNAEEVSGEVIDCFISHPSVRREYLKLSEADRRYMGSSKPINNDVGTKAGSFKEEVTFDAMPFKVDKDFVYGTLVGVNKGHLFWIPEVEGEWADEDGTVLFRVQNKDNYEARYRLFENFFSDKGSSHVRFDGISATVTAAVFAD